MSLHDMAPIAFNVPVSVITSTALAEAETAVGYTASPGQKLLSLYNPFSLPVEAWVREQHRGNCAGG